MAIPMTYYDEDSYPAWYRNWVDQEMVWRYDRHMVVGPAIYLNEFVDSARRCSMPATPGLTASARTLTP